ncbi:MAG: hypothetical protein LBQ07_01510 [Endomicrobium sp.]|jgi:hypothetical protein|nr:hypothetical protein [Endomicrobium sp.]
MNKIFIVKIKIVDVYNKTNLSFLKIENSGIDAIKNQNKYYANSVFKKQKYYTIRNNNSISKNYFNFITFFKKAIGFSSIEEFSNPNQKKIEKVISMHKKECFNKSLKILKEIETSIIYRNYNYGHIIASGFAKKFYGFCLDSTKVGIFIDNIDISKNLIKIIIVSSNSSLAHEFSNIFFKMILQ